jgi:hypothetical protein
LVTGIFILFLGSWAFAQNSRMPAGPMTFEQFKATRIDQMHHMIARVDQQLARPDLSAAQRQRLTQMKTRLARMQAMSPEQIDALLRRRFDKIDAAHTGVITPEQIRAFQQQERLAHQQAHAAGDGAPTADNGGAPARSPAQTEDAGDDFWPAPK